ncbi:hypothetical protein AAE02nite_39960 [Adhaeribacter aerolatus]|uniref:Integral membrane protein n=1 Tax=Adhaeribacter aerolatus TaxID=670289 RepID=A0A512B2Z0_9BACT|nr:hypothetical protein [Adhaeribacter aerolatus]GEO06332.1 hypothetical protein AAE02nite_39960 [Adhaeribacter aerolatus]
MIPKPVPVEPTLANSLLIGSGLFWTLTYLLILRRGTKDQIYGMPVAALCANLAWEFIFAFVFPHPYPQRVVNYIWLTFDLGIMWQYLKFGKKEFPAGFSSPVFYLNFLLGLVFSSLIIAFISVEFEEYIGYYAAFGQNLLMSVLFIAMLFKRNNVRGQSVYIALFKMLGTILASITFYLYFPKSYLLLLLYFAIFSYDIIYLFLLRNRLKAEGFQPWQRW